MKEYNWIEGGGAHFLGPYGDLLSAIQGGQEYVDEGFLSPEHMYIVLTVTKVEGDKNVVDLVYDGETIINFQHLGESNVNDSI